MKFTTILVLWGILGIVAFIIRGAEARIKSKFKKVVFIVMHGPILILIYLLFGIFKLYCNIIRKLEK